MALIIKSVELVNPVCVRGVFDKEEGEMSLGHHNLTEVSFQDTGRTENVFFVDNNFRGLSLGEWLLEKDLGNVAKIEFVKGGGL